MEQNCFCDKDKMNDLLSAEKFLEGTHSTFLLESATPEVKHCLLSLLQDTHSMQQQIFVEMQGRGWYQTPKAEDQKLMQTKQTFGGKVSG
jgi:spore coat protein CotF